MLAGRHPFNGNTAQEAYRAGLEAAPIDPLPHQWRALEHALSVHRDDRTPNVAQFLDEFGVDRQRAPAHGRFGGDEPIPPGRRPRRWFDADADPPAGAPGRERANTWNRNAGDSRESCSCSRVVALGMAAWITRTRYASLRRT